MRAGNRAPVRSGTMTSDARGRVQTPSRAAMGAPPLRAKSVTFQRSVSASPGASSHARAVPLNAAPAAPGQPETVVITDVINSAGVYFALRSRDASGNWSAASNSARRVTLDPREFAIGGVNAFPLPSTGRLRFTLDLTWTAEYRIDLFDLSGRRVGTPATGLARAGRTQVEWNGLLDGRPVQNGVYFYLVTARSGSETRTLKGRAVLIR